MGTHPIFESDFDCLTEMRLIVYRVATPSYSHGLFTRRSISFSTRLTDGQSAGGKGTPNEQAADAEREEAERAIYNSKQMRHFHAAMSNPVIKPYHSKKTPFQTKEKRRLIDQIRESRDKESRDEESGGSNSVDGKTETGVEELKTPKTALQIAGERIAKDNEPRYYTVKDYKPKCYEYGGLLTNLDVNYEEEVKRHQKWRKRLDFMHMFALGLMGLTTVSIVVNIIGAVVTPYYIPHMAVGEIQNMEIKLNRLEAQVAEGKNWNPDHGKAKAELEKVKAALAELRAAEEAENNSKKE